MQQEKRNSRKRPVCYPDSQVKITSPFYIMACSCGYREWRVFPEPVKCPKCDSLMKQSYPEEGGEAHDTPGEDQRPDGGGE